MSPPTSGRLGPWLVAHGRLVVSSIVLVSVLLGAAAVRLSFDFRFDDLLPSDHPFIQVHREYHHDFTEANVLTVMVRVRDGTIFTPETLGTIVRVTKAVERLPGVNNDQIDSLSHRDTRTLRVGSGGRMSSDPVMTGIPTTQAEARHIGREVMVAGHILGRLVSLDQRAAVIRAGFPERRLDYRAVFAAVNDTVLPLATETSDVYVAGPPRMNGWVLQLQRQMLLAFGAAVLVTWLMLHLYFRDWRGALRPTISGGLACLWGFGLMQLMGFPLNPLTLLIPFLITARAVSHSSQMHDRYYEELARGAVKHEAVQRAFGRLVRPTVAGIVTDALGVLAISLVAIPALRILGVVGMLWILSLLATELLLNPIVYGVLRAPHVETIRAREHGLLARAVERLAAFVLAPHGPRMLLAGATALSLGAVALLPQLRIGDPESASRILARDSEYNVSHRAIQESFGGSEPFVVIAEGDEPRALYDPAALRTIESLQRTLERHPVVSGSLSPVDLLRNMRVAFHEMEPKWGAIPSTEREAAQTFFTYWGFVPPSTSARFFRPDFSAAPVTFFCRDHAVQNVRTLVAAARRFIDTHPLDGVRFRLAAGFVGIQAAVFDEIARSEALMTVATFGAILFVATLTYGSFAAGLLLVLPLAAANVIVHSYMAARGIGLNVNTLPVVAVGVGFGIDYGIYVLSRIRESMRTGATLEASVRDTLTGAGRTVAFTALTMTAGTLCFVFTDLRFVAEMAVLLALWMVSSATAALTLIPALVLVVRPRFLREAARGGSTAG